MSARPLSLGLLLLCGGACSQIIGLGDYENTDGSGGGGGAATGGASSKGGTAGAVQGGRAGNGSGGASTSGGSGAAGLGGSGGSSGSGSEGGFGAQGGDIGEAGHTAGGVGGAGGADAGGTNDPGGAGGAATGGKSGTGGSATGGKAGTGGTTGGGGSGGKGGTGGTTGGSGGKGGAGGTGGKGGAGGTCSTQDLLLNSNASFDDSDASPPAPAPWIDFSTDDTALINSEAYLSNADVTPHTPNNALWMGGVGSSYEFKDGSLGEYYAIDLDLTIPVGTTQITLSCYYQSQTLETSATVGLSRDILVAWLWDYDSGTKAYEFQRWYPTNTTPGWHQFTNTATGAAATALAGRDLSLEFYSEVDDLRSTDFFIDTCSLRVTVCN